MNFIAHLVAEPSHFVYIGMATLAVLALVFKKTAKVAIKQN
jgi:hypothetical protein